MNHLSRTNNVIRNIIGGVGGQIFTSILQFFCRTVFISLLGVTYLGVNGLFSNILSMLSLAELGIGPAIVFSMYKPIADNDEVHVAKLMNFYRSAYRAVALIVLSVGIALTPFLEFFINDTTGIDNLRFIFILILLNTVVSYLYAYKGSILTADQKAYIVVIIRNIFAVVQNIAQIIILLIAGNYVLYLAVQIATTFLANVFLSKYVDRKYPFLTEYKNEKIDKTERASIIQKVKGMMMHKFGGFVLNGTDNLVISKFVGVVTVGIYSNYVMIINIIKSYLTQITGSVTASVGNLVASESREKVYAVFNAMLLVYFWIYALCFICFYVIFQPFITFWIGGDYLMDQMILLLVLVNFYLNGFQDCINNFVNATGLFWETRYKPIFECTINLLSSIVLTYKIGLAGVFIGTLASFVCTFWINPIVLYKKYFNKPVAAYFAKFFLYLMVTVAVAVGTDMMISQYVEVNLLTGIIIRIVLCMIVPNVLFLFMFHRSAGFSYCKQLGILLLKQLLKR